LTDGQLFTLAATANETGADSLLLSDVHSKDILQKKRR